MKTIVKYAMRCLILAAVLAVIVSFAGTRTPARTPYASALSGIVVGQAYAAPYCNNKACVGGSRFNLSCGTINSPYHCEKFGRNLCSNNPC